MNRGPAKVTRRKKIQRYREEVHAMYVRERKTEQRREDIHEGKRRETQTDRKRREEEERGNVYVRDRNNKRDMSLARRRRARRGERRIEEIRKERVAKEGWMREKQRHIENRMRGLTRRGQYGSPRVPRSFLSLQPAAA